MKDLDDWKEEGRSFLLLDVREDFERAAHHIGGIHIPMSELVGRQSEIPKDIPVVVYCKKGIRSTIVIQRLSDSGFQNLYNLQGGLSGSF